MNTQTLRSWAWLASLAATGALLAGCGAGSTPVERPAASVADSPEAAMNLVQGIATSPAAQADGAEPSTVPDTLAVDDTAEPRAVD
ncbi:hypothetical protein [Leptothrix discophora]|uniref:Lipoprotein n=1 Tax=Leptothrix discophora TaxID=89 RepID=A0ABT9G3Q5_LEPDI|nr:hypothetical protein [Leptothrix discophora]MDP4301099.1 hypothetical protein [Leptothrix discophora]